MRVELLLPVLLLPVLLVASACAPFPETGDDLAGAIGAESSGSVAAQDRALSFPNLLEHRGVPAEAEDWSFAPFADHGAWHGFGLPPEDRPELRGGFIGPFLMTSGRWAGAQLLQATIEDAATGAALDLAAADSSRAIAYPGFLRHDVSLAGLEIRLELWFESSRTTRVRLDLRNTGSDLRRLRLAWSGALFPDQGSLTLAEPGVMAKLADGTRLHIATGRPAVGELTEQSRYRLSLTGEVALPPGGAETLLLTLAAQLEGDAAPDHGRVPATAFAERSHAENRARWNHYLAAVDTGRAADDPVQILAVKSLQTLVNNWRGPAGRMRYNSLFPSSNVGYFNGYWAWDSWKHAVGIARFDTELAKDQVRAMFDHQNGAGMIADVVYLDPAEDNWRDTKPPLAGWAIETIYRATGDLDFVRDLYPRLVAYHEFWYAERDHDRDGLCEYGSTDGTLVAARWESGMDNAVRFDHTEMLSNGPHAWSMNQESVDLNSYLYREKQALRELAGALERPADVERWSGEAEQLRARIQRAMFDPASGWFYDVHYQSGEIVPVQGPEGWIPLWTGVATEAQAAGVRQTMLDPNKFRTLVPFPTVARDHPEFSDGYWRGLVWLDQAYFAIEGLRRYGYEDDADSLVNQLLTHLEGATTPGVSLRENYRPLTGEGANVHHFSCTAAHLLLLALSESD